MPFHGRLEVDQRQVPEIVMETAATGHDHLDEDSIIVGQVEHFANPLQSGEKDTLGFIEDKDHAEVVAMQVRYDALQQLGSVFRRWISG